MVCFLLEGLFPFFRANKHSVIIYPSIDPSLIIIIIIVSCYDISTPSAEPAVFNDKHIHTLYGKSAKLLNIKVGDSHN